MESLITEVKQKLKITWEDEDTMVRLEQLVSSAVPSLIFKLGLPEEYKFSEPGMEHGLFLNYCMYEWNNCAEEFDSNYLNEIMQVRAKWEVKHHKDQ